MVRDSGPPRGVTIRDVAREAGVSVATVSRVFNQSGPVKEETRRRVREVAKRLRYSPSSAARSLIIRRTHTLGVLLPELFGEFFSEIIRGIDHVAQESDYHLLVSSSHHSRKTLRAALRSMRGRVDGLLLVSPDIDAPTLTENLPLDLPVVLVNCSVEGRHYASLNVDNYGGAYAMVRHLLQAHGHRHVALIRGSEVGRDSEDRLRGYREALRDHGGEWVPELEFLGDFTESGGYLATRRLLERPLQPTAVFAANDSMAIGAMCALREAGRRVPEDVGVVGFDDIPTARFVTPPLTSVQMSISDLGARACKRLIQVVTDQKAYTTEQEVLPARLALRASCGCEPM